MKTKSFIIALMAGAFALTACQDKDWEVPDSIISQPPYGNNDLVAGPIVTIAELQTQFSSAISSDNYKQITDDLWLRCVVTGNDFGGNIYKQISVQDETAGIIIGINGSDQGAFMPVGQKLLISLKDLYIGGYGNQAQIGGLYNGGLGRMELSTWKQHVRLIMDGTEEAKAFGAMKVDTIDFDPNKTMAQQGGRVVRLKNVTISGDGTQIVAPDDGSVSLVSNCVNRTISGGNAGSKCVLRTSTYADFKGVALPKQPVELYGIATIYRGTWQILARTQTDLTWTK
ncbi:MAG: DUF5689 domain-containing protein [Bacteroidaceae bacterium]|nr:DUF5689 domain-containing protein [Bacteroidaceae bacterium]